MASTTPFGPIYEDVPLDPSLGYPAGAAVRIRANPTKGQWQAWLDGNSPAPEETKEQKEVREVVLLSALHALYSAAALPGFDFSTPEATRTTWDAPDLPDELWVLLLNLPWTVITARRDAILKNALRSSPHQDSIETSPTATA